MNTDLTYDFPDDRYYDGDNHMWAKMDGLDKHIVVGIDALGLEALGEIAYISLPAAGVPVQRGEAIGTLEAAKMTSAVIAPVSGTLVARNKAAMRDPQMVNDDPYDQGWLVAIEANNWDVESVELVHGPTIPAWVTTEIERYRNQGWIE
ncbi:MAG: glycine cleavage system protein H [Anaerolineae bacterium]